MNEDSRVYIAEVSLWNSYLAVGLLTTMFSLNWILIARRHKTIPLGSEVLDYGSSIDKTANVKFDTL